MPRKYYYALRLATDANGIALSDFDADFYQEIHKCRLIEKSFTATNDKLIIVYEIVYNDPNFEPIAV